MFLKDLPCARAFFTFIAGLNIIATLISIIFSYLAFTQLEDKKRLANAFYWSLVAKSFLISFFLAFEYYDLLFENIYKDV